MRLGDGFSLADVVRGLDAEGVSFADIELRAPTLDDVLLAKTGRSLEGSGEPADRSDTEDEEEPIRAIVQR
jgi:ABC-2 type transport system ATP-binding protein